MGKNGSTEHPWIHRRSSSRPCFGSSKSALLGAPFGGADRPPSDQVAFPPLMLWKETAIAF